jgi:hypothetical protein
MLGCALVVNVPVKYVAETRLPPVNELLEPITVLTKVPVEVMFGCADCVTVVAVAWNCNALLIDV